MAILRRALCVCVGVLIVAVEATAQPATLTLERDYDQEPAPRGHANPTEADHALALYREDEWNRALVCPEQRAATQPADRHRIRCDFAPVGVLATGPVALTVALASTHHEFDGMYGTDEDVVVLARNPMATEATVVATLSQLSIDVVDCLTTFRMRRQRVLDLDGDHDADLCIVSVEETGPGLFSVMSLRGRAFRPARRSRGIDAWSVSPAGELVRRAALDGSCPRRGYRPFVERRVPPSDPIERRRLTQGDAREDVDSHQRVGCP